MYIIQRVMKHGSSAVTGIQQENNRTPDMKGRFPLSDINWDKTDQNVFLRKTQQWMPEIKSEIRQHGISSFRKDAILLIEVIYTASPVFFTNNEEQHLDFFQDCLTYHDETYGKALNCVIHFDETTPHMHTVSVPFILRDSQYRLSAKELIGPCTKMRERQTLLFETVGKKYGLERGESQDHIGQVQHLSTYKLKLQTVVEKIETATIELMDLEKQCHMLEAKIDHSTSIIEIQSMVTDLSRRLTIITEKITDIPINKLFEHVENNEIIIDSNILSAHCNMETIDYSGQKYCYIVSHGGEPLTWNKTIPLYIQDGIRYIPAGLVSKDGQITYRNERDYQPEQRDPIEKDLSDHLEEIRDDIEMLQEKTEDQLVNDIENDRDPIDNEE